MPIDEQELKRSFALALMATPHDPFGVAFNLFKEASETARAIEVATKWPTDAEVLEYQRAAVAKPLEAGALADKHQAAREILERARKCADDETYGKLMRLYADIMGQVEKAGSNSANVTVNLQQNKVLVMPATRDKHEWSAMAVHQQRELAAGNA